MYVLDIYTKYTWVVSLKNKIYMNLVEPNRKPNKIWGNKGSESCNRSIKSWLKGNGIEICSSHNDGKSAVARRFIGTLKNKIYKYLISKLKNMYIDKLADIVKE